MIINFNLYYILFALYRWQELSVMNTKFKSSKTIWPIPQTEQVFLPDFKIKPLINENTFQVTKKLYFYTILYEIIL